MEKVQPLVHIYHPRNERVHRFPEAFYGIDDDDDIKIKCKAMMVCTRTFIRAKMVNCDWAIERMRPTNLRTITVTAALITDWLTWRIHAETYIIIM